MFYKGINLSYVQACQQTNYLFSISKCNKGYKETSSVSLPLNLFCFKGTKNSMTGKSIVLRTHCSYEPINKYFVLWKSDVFYCRKKFRISLQCVVVFNVGIGKVQDSCQPHRVQFWKEIQWRFLWANIWKVFLRC